MVFTPALYHYTIQDTVVGGSTENDKYIRLNNVQVVGMPLADFTGDDCRGNTFVGDLADWERRLFKKLQLRVWRPYVNPTHTSWLYERGYLLRRLLEISTDDTDLELLEPRPLPRYMSGHLIGASDGLFRPRNNMLGREIDLTFKIRDTFDFSAGDQLKANTYWVKGTHAGGNATAYGGNGYSITLPANTAITFTKKSLNTPTSHAWTLHASFTATGGLATGTATGTTPALSGSYACSVVCANAVGAGNTLNFTVVVP